MSAPYWKWRIISEMGKFIHDCHLAIAAYWLLQWISFINFHFFVCRENFQEISWLSLVKNCINLFIILAIIGPIPWPLQNTLKYQQILLKLCECAVFVSCPLIQNRQNQPWMQLICLCFLRMTSPNFSRALLSNG